MPSLRDSLGSIRLPRPYTWANVRRRYAAGRYIEKPAPFNQIIACQAVAHDPATVGRRSTQVQPRDQGWEAERLE